MDSANQVEMTDGEFVQMLVAFVTVVGSLALIHFLAKRRILTMGEQLGGDSYGGIFRLGYGLVILPPIFALITLLNALGMPLVFANSWDTIPSDSLMFVGSIIVGWGLLGLRRWAVVVVGLGVLALQWTLLRSLATVEAPPGFTISSEFRVGFVAVSAVILCAQNRALYFYVRKRWSAFR